MREFNIDLVELSESKKNDIRKAMWVEVEVKYFNAGIKLDTLKIAEIVDELMETFICVARVKSVEEVN